MKHHWLALLLLGSLAAPAPIRAELTIATDFPGGSAELLELDAGSGTIRIAPSHHDGRGWPCWWYFRIDGAIAGQPLRVVVTATDKPFRAEQRLAATWALPSRAAISTNNAAWRQTTEGTITSESGTYEIAAPAEQFWLAWGPPFLPAQAESLLAGVAQRLPEAERFVLATTRQGRRVHGIRIGPAEASQALWVQARQHAWESGGSWVGHGFLQWLGSEDPDAAALRSTTEVYFIPIMDVDNVVLGAGGKEAVPRDHNRDWSDEPVYPEVAAAQRRIAALIDSGRLRAYIDLHNPGANARRPFFYGPFDYEQMVGPQRRNYDKLLELTVATMHAPLAIQPAYRFATYVRTEEERQRMSSNWVRRRGGEQVVAVTLETPFNTRSSTTEGYQQVGQQLARALAHYLVPAGAGR